MNFRTLGYNVADLAESIHFLSEVWYDYMKGNCSIHKARIKILCFLIFFAFKIDFVILEKVIEEYKKHGFQVNQDVPGNVYWEALYHASPNAKVSRISSLQMKRFFKVILTVRDSTEAWKKSFVSFLKQENLRWGNPGFWILHRLISFIDFF